jgi:acyl-CoA dehydrogenase
MLLGEGRGFEISPAAPRPGPHPPLHALHRPGRKALDLMVARPVARGFRQEAGDWLGGNMEIISRARIEIEAMRLMVLKAAKAMDVLGNREARIWVHMVKAMVPERVCKIIDQAIQMHGATGVSQWTPLAHMYTQQRTLRLADGPDEVHHLVVGRNEGALCGGDPARFGGLRLRFASPVFPGDTLRLLAWHDGPGRVRVEGRVGDRVVVSNAAFSYR